MAGRKGKLRLNRVITLYSDDEFEELRKKYARTTCRTFSGYVRKVSLEEPVAVVVRNGSFDAYVDEITVLRKQMRQIYEEGKLDRENQERLISIHGEMKVVIDKIFELCMPN